MGSVSISHWLLPHSIYTLKLHKRGLVFPFVEQPEAPPVGAAPQPEPTR